MASSSSSSGSSISSAAAPVMISHVLKVKQPLLSSEKRKEYFLANSLLRRPEEPAWARLLTTKLFASIENGADIKGSDLEAIPMKDAATIYLEYIKDLQGSHKQFPEHHEVIFKLIPLLSDFVANCDLEADDLAKLVLNLKNGQEVLIPGGWGGAGGGHAMLYLFSRNQRGLYDVSIFNTGDGIGFHTNLDGVDWKDRTFPIVYYKDVTPEELCLPSSEFFKKLVAFNNRCPVQDEQARHLYVNVFGHLEEKRHVPPFLSALTAFIGAQRSGTCGYNVFKALILSKIIATGPAFIRSRLYKWFHFHFKEDVDAAYFKKVKRKFENGGDVDQDLLLLKQAASNLARSVVKCAPFLQPQEQETGFATALDLRESVDGMNAQMHKDLRGQIERLPDFATIVATPERQVDRSEMLKAAKESNISKNVAAQILTHPLRELRPPTPETLSPFLQEAIDGFKRIAFIPLEKEENDDLNGAAYQLEKALSQLPSPSDAFWDHVPDILSCLMKLDELLILYSKIADHEHENLPKRVNTAFHALAFIHRLAVRHEKQLFQHSLLEEKGIELSRYFGIIHDPFHVHLEPREEKQRSELLQYFSKVKGSLFDFEKLNEVSDTSVEQYPDAEHLRSLMNAGGQASALLRKELADKALAWKEKLPKEASMKDFTLAMLGYLSDVSYSPNDNSAYIHLKILRRALMHAAFYSQGSCVTNDRNAVIHTKEEMPNKVFLTYGTQDGDVLCTNERNFKDFQARNGNGETNFPRLSQDAKKFVMKGPLFKREATTTESEAMLRFQKSAFCNKMVAATGGTPLFQARKLLYYFLHHIEDLAQSDVRILFQLLLFKPQVDKQGIEITPLFEKVFEKSFITLCRNFVERGIDRFSRLMPKNSPDIYSSLFFIRLAQRIQRINPNAFPKATMDAWDEVMQGWLKNKKELSPSERSDIHYHLAFNNILRYREDRRALKQIIVSWFSAHLANPDFASREKLMMQDVQEFFYEYQDEIQHLLANSQLRNEIFAEVFAKTGLIADSHQWEERAFPLYTNGTWKLNLNTGQVGNDFGLAIDSGNRALEEPDYKRLFGDRNYTFTSIGNSKFFSDPQLGSFQIKQGANGQIVILRQDPISKEWLQYIRPYDLYQLYPLNLVYDCSHWLAQDGSERIQFLDLKTWKPLGVATQGKIELTNGNTVVDRDYASSNALSLFEHFEELSWIDVQEKAGKLASITIPRYESLQGKPLHFTAQEGKLVWRENPDFSLVHQQKGLLGFVDNYLLLASKKKRKVIIPLQPFISTIHYGRNNHLKLIKEGDKTDGQRGCNRFLEFDLKGNALVPLNTEGQLFLIYIDLVNKKYEKAVGRLKLLSHSENFSPLSQDILKWIMSSASLHVVDNTPDAIATRLQALYLYIKFKTQPAIYFKEMDSLGLNDIYQFIQNDYKQYQKTLSHVNAALRLTQSEEAFLLENYYSIISHWEKDNGRRAFVLSETVPQRKITAGSIFRKEERDGYYLKESCHFGQNDWERLEQYNEMIHLGDPAKGEAIHDRFGLLYFDAKSIKTMEELTAFSKKLQLLLLYAPGATGDSLDEILAWLLHFTARSSLLKVKVGKPDKAPELGAPADKLPWLKRLFDAYGEYMREHRGRFVPMIPKENKLPDGLLNLPVDCPAISVDPIHPYMSFGPAVPTRKGNDDLKAFYPDAIEIPQLRDLLDKYFKKESRVGEDYSRYFNWNAATDALSQDDRVFMNALQDDLKEYRTDLTDGAGLIRKMADYHLPEENLPALRQALEERKRTLEASTRARRKVLLVEANSSNLQENALRLGGIKKMLTIRDLKNLLLSNSIINFQTALPRTVNIPSFVTKLVNYEVEWTALKQIKRALAHIEKIEDPSSPDEKDDSLTALSVELEAETHYNPYAEFLYLIFEDRADLKLREDQVLKMGDLLMQRQKMYRNSIIQMLMGQGKTSVIAAIMLFIAAKQNRLSAFIVPSAQFQSVKQNLIATQKRIFNQDIIAIDVPWKEFNPRNLAWIIDQIREAQNKQQFVLIRQETVQALEVELFAEFLKGEGSSQKAKYLKAILRILAKNSDAFIDEIDIAMNPDKELNRPVGVIGKMKPYIVDLLGEVMRLHVSDDLNCHGRPIKQMIGLRENRQSSMNKEEYTTEIRSNILTHLFNNYPGLRKFPIKEQEFLSYCDGTMPDNHPFGEQIKQYVKDADIQVREAVQMIAFLRGLFSNEGGVLLYTLTRSTGRHYGRNSKAGIGKVSPYLGVGTPAATEFASVDEVAALHFQTALSQSVSERQVAITYNKYKMTAHMTAKSENILLEETKAAQDWFAMTKVPFSDMEDNPEALTKATLAINQGDPKYIIEIEKDTILQAVTFYTQFISSNAQNFISQFSTKRGVTGTPWNKITYEKSQQDSTILAKGVAGMITARMFDTVEANSFHIVKKADVREFLATAKTDSPHKFDKVRALIDVGGFLKNTPDNLTVAKQILEFYKNDPNVQSVLFFGKKEDNDMPDHLMLLKKDDPNNPIFIGKTKKEELDKFQINTRTTFVYFDERHTEATDIPLMGHAVSLKTMGKDVQTRSDLQASMRARKYLSTQEIEYILMQEELPRFVGDLPSLIDQMKRDPTKENARQVLRSIAMTQIFNQTKRKSTLNPRAFRHKIDNVFRTAARNSVLEGQNTNLNEFEESAIVTNVQEEPFDKFGALKKPVSTKDMLIDYADKRLQYFKTHLKFHEEVSQKIEDLKQEIRDSVYLPPTSYSSNLGTEHYIEQVAEQDVDRTQTQDIQLEQELQQELDRYRSLANDNAFVEKPWDPNPVLDPMLTVSDVLQKVPYVSSYHHIFTPGLQITENLAKSADIYIPVFNETQKSADQILVIAKAGEPVRFLLLSQQDEQFFETYLKQNAPQDLWLIFADGREISDHQHRALNAVETDQYDKLMLEANIFNGGSAYLNQKAAFAWDYINKSPERETILRYLKLKSAYDDQKKVLLTIFLEKEHGAVDSIPSASAASASKPVVYVASPPVFRRERLERKGDREDD